jgi:peptidoglycan hydrolase CwlO-like protein
MKPWKYKYSLIIVLVLCVCILVKPYKATGEVKPIEEANEQLQGISREEQQTLEKLFIYTQELEEMEREEARITDDIDKLIIEIEELDSSIIKEQENYDMLLSILEQVLVSYQRGGPASYLDILLSAKDLTSFIKSLNLIKDISKNTGELLASIEKSKQQLEVKKQSLADRLILLEDKREELTETIAAKKRIVKEQEDYLESLAEKKQQYQEYLDSLKLMWDNLKELFSKIVDEFARIISEGHFTMEDLNLQFGFFNVKGAIHEDTFNRIINENSTLSRINLSFGQDKVRIEVPDNNLVLDGYFEMEGSTLLFVPEKGTFYGMALEKESIDELFRNGPLIIDLNEIAGDMVTIDFKLKDVKTTDGYINFSIDIDFGSLF